MPTKNPKAAFLAAAGELQAGRFEAARRGFSRLAKKHPESAAIWYNLGLCEQYLDNLQAAAGAYRKSLRLRADQPEARVNLGLALLAQGLHAEAIQQGEAALKHAPDHLRALNLLATAHAEQGDLEAAAKVLEQAAAIAPNDPDTRHNQAGVALQHGDPQAAREHLAPLAGADAARKHQLLWVQILIACAEPEPARNTLQQLLSEQPDDPPARRLELALLEAEHDYTGIIDRAPALLKTHPDAPTWNRLGNAWFQLSNRPDHALDCYRKAIKLAPGNAEYHHNLGLILAAAGETRAALDCYRKALDLRPDYIEAWRNLVAMRPFTEPNDPDVTTIRALAARTDQPPDARMRLNFMLGKIHDDLGDYEKAFKHYAAGNRALLAEAAADITRQLQRFDRIEYAFTHPPAASSTPPAGRAPIFILGMPRSGTTLIEQIFCRHPRISGCGELPCIEQAIRHLEQAAKTRVYPDDFPKLTATELGAETTRYLNWVSRFHPQDTPFFTDKQPFNFLHIWLLRALFPHAPIICCHRHPLDVIVSNYFQLYEQDLGFAYDLESLARYYLRFHRLMRHWQAVFPGQIQRVDYENLIADEAGQTRRLIEKSGLDWHADCLRPSAAPTAARTASLWQVRQNIYTSSAGRWRHYAEQLAPAIDILREGGVLDDEFNEVEVGTLSGS